MWRQAKLPPPKPCMSRMAVPGLGEGFCSNRKGCDEFDEPAVTGGTSKLMCTVQYAQDLCTRPKCCIHRSRAVHELRAALACMTSLQHTARGLGA